MLLDYPSRFNIQTKGVRENKETDKQTNSNKVIGSISQASEI